MNTSIHQQVTRTMLWRQVDNALRLGIRNSRFAPALRKRFKKQILDEAIARGSIAGWDAGAHWLMSDAGRGCLEAPRFHEFLRNNINTDIQTEQLLTALRQRLLIASRETLARPEITATLCSLIQQCLNNEYVWFVSDDEKMYLAALRETVESSGKGAPVDWSDVAKLALYARPNEVVPQTDPAGWLAEDVDGMPEPIRDFMNTYMAEYAEETALKTSIESFGGITRSTSKLIADNYEQYPYPRWISMEIPEAGKRQNHLRSFFDSSELEFLKRPFSLLVAGCGTGNKAIEYALSYGERAQVLAVDLSRASLAYAARMARRYRVSNIRFLQIDLLELPKLERTFDIVECTGVLHHLKDPLEGGRALVECTRDGGIVHISLYSELARREIVRLRSGYEERIPDMTSDDVRQYRRRLMMEDPDLIDNRLPLRWDFFDLNRCKDLLFHPLEHRFTIPKIGQFLVSLGLQFRGIEAPDLIRSQYWTPYPPESARRDLSRWNAFEQANPDAFASLYEIWALKT